MFRYKNVPSGLTEVVCFHPLDGAWLALPLRRGKAANDPFIAKRTTRRVVHACGLLSKPVLAVEVH